LRPLLFTIKWLNGLSEIRVTYSGLISFATLVVSIITGTIFTIIVTRRLDPDDFAIWALIGSLFVFVMIFDPISSYWTNRQVARNEQVAVTAVGTNSLFSVFGIIIYIAISVFLAYTSDVDLGILLFGALMIPFVYIIKILRAITGSYKPQGNGYSLLISEFTKIPIGLALIYFLDMGIIGAITTTILASSTQLLFYFYYINNKFREKFSLQVLRRWLKNSWLSFYSGNTGRLSELDVVFYSSIFGSIGGLAYVGVSKTMGNLVSMTSYLSAGLFPKLIATKKEDFIILSLKRTMFFSIPLLFLVLVFSKPGLWILNPVYIDGASIVIVWAFAHFVMVFLNIFSSALTGLDAVDEKKNPTFKDFLKSRLFFVPTIDHIFRIIYLGILGSFFAISIFLELSVIDTIFLWGVAVLITSISIMTIYYKKLRAQISFKFPSIISLKYLLVGIGSSVPTFLLMDRFLEYHESIFEFFPHLLPFFILQVGIYLIVTIACDTETRNFVLSILREIKR
jgi:hypothetical protein